MESVAVVNGRAPGYTHRVSVSRVARPGISEDERLPLVDLIREAIRQRLLVPGAPLIQSAIADALDVSKIPVREALHALAAEGLVTFTDDGARVTLLSPSEIYEVWTLRSVIEPGMAKAIVRELQPNDLARIATLVEAMGKAADGDEWSDLNYAFHQDLYGISALPHFTRLASHVLTLIEPYSRVAVNRLSGQPAAQAEHREMLVALEDSDAERLEQVLVRHSTRARDLLVDYVVTAVERPSRHVATSEAARAFVARLEAET